MRITSRLALCAAALLLIPAFWLPLWSIRIVAPQYREGLGMFIGVRDIWGHTEHDIQNINILNHYIGMKAIDPEIVGVLTIMPWVLGLMILAAALIALIGRKTLVMAWLALFAAAGGAGLYEFYSWAHDYGHNLDPMAPIKIPGMAYQPPILGTKQLLNMTTSSYPSWGTLFIALAIAAGVFALWREHRRAPAASELAPVRRAARTERVRRAGLATAGLMAVLLVAACAQPAAERASGPPEFAAGGPCAYCDGDVPESRFGGRIVSTSGDVYQFMSVECLAGFLLEGRIAAERIASIEVVDYSHGERLIEATTARYLRMQFEESPNGLNLAAVETERVAGTLHYFHGGERMSWDQVLEYVRQEWRL